MHILDDDHAGEHALGTAGRQWLRHSLKSLNESLNDALSVYRGGPVDILLAIAARFGVKAVCWNRCYEPWRTARDTTVLGAWQLQQNGYMHNRVRMIVSSCVFH